MILGLSLKLFWRELKSGQLSVMLFALILAVTCVAGISLFTDRLEKALELQTSEFLGGDIKYESNIKLSNEFKSEDLNLKKTEMVLFASVVSSNEAMQFSSIKVVDEHYPLIGSLELKNTSPESFNTKEPPSSGNVWLDQRLLDLLELEIGDSVYVGENELQVSHVLVSEPDRGSNNYAFAPKLIMNKKDLAATNIIKPGSRVRFSYLFLGENKNIEELKFRLEKIEQPGDSITLVGDDEGSLGRAVERSGNFFLLGGILAVLMAAFTIGISSQRFSRRHISYVAILRTLGSSSNEIKGLYSLIFLELAFFSLAIGLILGWFAQDIFINLMQSYFPSQLPDPGIKPLYVSSLTVLICLIGFVYPHITKLIKIPPLTILRREASSAKSNDYFYPLMSLLAMFMLLLLYTEQIFLSSILFFGILFSSLFCLSVIRLFFGRKIKPGLGANSPFSLAWSELHRRRNSNSLQVLAFMIAIGLTLIAYSARTDLMETWESSLPEESPNNFAINITSEDLKPIETFMSSNGITSNQFFPVTSTRLELITKNNEANKKLIDRSFNMTWVYEMPSNNELSEGEWFGPDQSNGLSLSDEIATRYDLKIGDKLKVDVSGTEIYTFVQSIRKVNWESFSPNFFVVGYPGLFQEIPATYITSFYSPKEDSRVVTNFMSEFRTVSLLSIDEIIQQVSDIIEQVSKALEVILGLTILSALFLATSSLQDSFNLRLHQAAVLRTLGASNRLLQRSILIEFSFLGLLAGLLGAFLAQTGLYFLEKNVFEVPVKFHLSLWLIGPLIGIFLVSILSMISVKLITRKSPKEILFNS
jgi:putative ABC transport system permease protein|tara:strand:- start:546 stop:2993 length:2448 start_codon:yes stop_codon:yes gene_type:complete